MIICGLDPGVHGGIAILSSTVTLLLEDLPTFQTDKVELDPGSLALMLNRHPIDHVFIEKVAARPGQGVTSMFRFGFAAGLVYGVAASLLLPITLVAPTVWQKRMGCGPSPDAARQRAGQLYPDAVAQLGRKKDTHRADALLIAAYGLHTLTKG